MAHRTNEFDQPIGDALPDWVAAEYPKIERMEGVSCDLELLDSGKHAADLFAAYQEDHEGKIWTYLSYGPFHTLEDYTSWLNEISHDDAFVFYAILDKETGKALGVASYMRIVQKDGVVEVGHICLSPGLQRTRAATETMFLMMKHAFDVFGYRRYEWKCDALNAPSCRAAGRLGFRYEGLFRQATLYKGRTRDTAWYSILDNEWPHIKSAYEEWLSPDNFSSDGEQKTRLADLIAQRRP